MNQNEREKVIFEKFQAGHFLFVIVPGSATPTTMAETKDVAGSEEPNPTLSMAVWRQGRCRVVEAGNIVRQRVPEEGFQRRNSFDDQRHFTTFTYSWSSQSQGCFLSVCSRFASSNNTNISAAA